jgi:hypothetical protein
LPRHLRIAVDNVVIQCLPLVGVLEIIGFYALRDGQSQQQTGENGKGLFHNIGFFIDCFNVNMNQIRKGMMLYATIAMLFLFTAFALKYDCKDTNIFPYGKIIHENSRSFVVIPVEKKTTNLTNPTNYSRYSCHSCSEKDDVDTSVSPASSIGLQKVFQRPSAYPLTGANGTPVPVHCSASGATSSLRTRSDCSPVV